MKTCDLTQSYAATGGGVRTYLHAKRDFIRDRAPEHEHLLIVPGAEDAVRREGRLTTYTVASPPVPGSRVYRLLLRSDKVLRILRAERPGTIDVHCAYNLPWTALHHRDRAPGVRVVGMYMTDLPRAYVEPVAARALGRRAGGGVVRLAERYVRALYRRMDATVAISPALAERLCALGVPDVRCVPLGVDLQCFHPARRSDEVRRRLGVGEGEPLLVYAGRLDSEKRAGLVMDAWERLPPELAAHLVLVGDGPLREPLRERAERSGGRARVLPFLSDRQELAALLASADLYVSAMPYETFGLSVIEAQAAGLPVVGVAGGAMVDRVPEGSGTGLLGPVDSVEHLADNIVRLLRGDPRAAGRRARALVEERFSWAATFEQMFALYQALHAQPLAR